MLRLLPLRALALLTFTAGCAGVRPHGALSPVGARVTNEVLADDALTFDAWQRRLAIVQQAGAPRHDRRAYAAARAGAWLAYARDSYAWDPRDGTVDVAFTEARRLVLALERDSVPDLAELPLVPDALARPDLWAAIERARDGAAMQDAPAALAGAEVALVRASRLASAVSVDAMATRQMSAFERACELEIQVATAERLVAALGAVAAPAHSGAPVVALAGDAAPELTLPPPALRTVAPIAPPPVRVSVNPAAPAPAAPRRAVQRVVHFALGSSELALPSRLTLGEVIAMLRTNPGVNVVISGFTDVRGSQRHNRELALRRATTVRRFLEGARLELGRVTVAAPGSDAAGARSADALAHARDRRVTLTFTGPNGQPLTLAASQALDVDHERDIQIEQERRPRSRAALPPTNGASRRSATPR